MATVGLLDSDTETDAEAPHPPEYAITLYVPAALTVFVLPVPPPVQ